MTEQQNVDPENVDLLVGGLAGALASGGGFCAGSSEVVEHQRLSAASYTFSAALPALLATTASETVTLLQEQPEIIQSLRENIRTMRAQLDPRSDWVRCTSSAEAPVMLLVLKSEHVQARNYSVLEQEMLLQECVDEVGLEIYSVYHTFTDKLPQALTNGVLITRLKAMPLAIGATPKDLLKEWRPQPALKVCVTNGLSKRDIERAGVVVRHAITTVMKSKKWQR